MQIKGMRLFRIIYVALRYGLDEIVLLKLGNVRFLRWVGKICFWRDLSLPAGVRLRCALEELGPIFVKFGQVLSTRRDVMPEDWIVELAKLQDRVKEFETSLAMAEIKTALKRPLEDVFTEIDPMPVASASVAQVYRATLKKEGVRVAIKVLRPGVKEAIEQDVALMYKLASWVERSFEDGPRLKPKEIVAEFDQYLHDEIDLLREAANASQLKRNFANSDLLLVPQVYWDYCTSLVMVMEWMEGVPISEKALLLEAGVDLKKLSRDGVEIFFTQVFRDGFFHADMHPGNILVSTLPETKGRYIALDLGIVGTLNEFDKKYLSQNFLAFFRRDYKKVAKAHIESGWAPKDTRVDELENAVRACCEPIFDRPLKDISFGTLLLRLFQTSRRFNIVVQPQLILLQKTLLNIEALGRDLDPDLDLWKTAKPFLENWMQTQVGWQGAWANLKEEWPYYAHVFPQLPRLLSTTLLDFGVKNEERNVLLRELIHQQKQLNRWFEVFFRLIIAVLVGVALYQVGRWIYLFLNGYFP